MMITDERRWDIYLIHDVFKQRDVNFIVATTLSKIYLIFGTVEKKVVIIR